MKELQELLDEYEKRSEIHAYVEFFKDGSGNVKHIDTDERLLQYNSIKELYAFLTGK